MPPWPVTNAAGQTKVSEDKTLVEELHQHGKHAQEQAVFHRGEATKFERIAEACSHALNVLEVKSPEYDYDEADAPPPSRFR